MSDEPTIAEFDPVNAALFAADQELATRRYEYLISRRDQSLEKLRFGLLALNGASLVALISALGGDGTAATWLGFDADRARYSAAAFILGTVCGGVSIIVESNLQRVEAGDAVARQSTLNRLTALYSAKFTKGNYDRVGPVMEEYHKLPLVDFRYSIPALISLNASAGAWLFGVAMPLLAALGR
ncbi:MAG: hypothetical protein ACK4GG_01825 [Sphingomonas sp.]